jgi:excisionase family DNA binding protein
MVKQKPERIQSPAVARILGVTAKTVCEMAVRGDLPSAARIGRRWTFNEQTIRKWVSQKELEVQTAAKNVRSWLQRRRPPIDVSEPYWIVDEQYERAIGLNRLGAIRYRERQKRKLAKKE